jgi:bifunctional non-homologous end joining protein LigD
LVAATSKWERLVKNRRRQEAPTPSCSARQSKADGALVFAKACALGCEGIVSKRAGSIYKSGPCRNWLKTKNPKFVRRSPGQ